MTQMHSFKSVQTQHATISIIERLGNNEQTQTFELPSSGQIKIGRTVAGASHGPNDVVLDARFIGRDQALIDASDQGHRFVDLGSGNKFMCRGVPITDRHLLRDGDRLQVRDPTTGDTVTITYHNQALNANIGASADLVYPLDNVNQITLGRFGCTFHLDHPTISRTHAQITRHHTGGHALVDVGSTNGTFLNGTRLHAHAIHYLNPSDTIRIGPFKLIYHSDRIEQYDERGAFHIDVQEMSLAVRRGKKILNNISLSIAPCEFVAFVGGSGAGKSTLLKAICGFKRANSGHRSPVRINGDDYYANFDLYRTQLGYVPQDDILHSSLTASEALRYAARLRLPDADPATITQRIDQALAAVEMNQHRDTVIEKLSGGQRKRVSIAAELLAEPSLFFLDEPTSGLDPGLEMKMMEMMRRLADNGRTIMLVTHATENIKQCHHVVFLAEGRLVYFGPPDEALQFFQVAKFAEIYTQLEGSADNHQPVVRTLLTDAYAQWQADHGADKKPTMAELWELKYQRSDQYRRYVLHRQSEIISRSLPPVQQPTRSTAPRISPWRQYILLTQRYFNLLFRDWGTFLVLLCQAPIIGIMLLLLTRPDTLTGVVDIEQTIARIQAQNLAFMLVTVGVWFGIINAARELTKEYSIYQRERMSNLRIGPYIASKITGLSLLMVIQNAVLLMIVGLRVEFPSAEQALIAPPWIEMFLTMMLVSSGGMIVGLLISACSANADQAISVVPLALIPQILFAGMIFDIEPGTVVEAFSWLMISRWGIDALGTTLNLNNLCQLPNVTYNNTIQPQCQVTESLRNDGGSGAQLLDTYPFMNQTLENAKTFPEAFVNTVNHLQFTWSILTLFIVVGIMLTILLLKRRDYQK